MKHSPSHTKPQYLVSGKGMKIKSNGTKNEEGGSLREKTVWGWSCG